MEVIGIKRRVDRQGEGGRGKCWPGGIETDGN